MATPATHLHRATLALGLLFVACETPPPAAAADSALLMPFSGPVRGLFDDGIDAEVFGAPGDGTGSSDSKLPSRVRSSNVVFPAQVTTVTDQSDGAMDGVEIELSPIEKPFYGSLASFIQTGTESLRVIMRPGTVGYALLKTNQGDLIGKRLVVCLGRFDDNGVPTVHWHATEDSPNVRQAIVAAASMADLVK